MNNILYVLLRRLRAPLILLISIYAISMLGFVLIPGRDDAGQPWRMDFFHAFYFVSFMGPTIGFGEIPYPFTAGQRMWAVASIYATVLSWLYAIGITLANVQDPAFRRLVKATSFRRAVRRIAEPFYLVCGYGDTGTLLVRALADAGIRAVVVDIDESRVDALELEDLCIPAPGLCADAADPAVLAMAGLSRPTCVGVVALTNRDPVNLTSALTASLLRPRLRTIARAETREGGDSIASLGDVEVIDPFETFAGRLALALHAPGLHLLFEWLTGVPHERARAPLFPPHGTWILCGYGRFGKAVYRRLSAEGIAVRIIEADVAGTRSPPDTVPGLGADAETLQRAGVGEAVGIVAGTDNDANNLSIIVTARALNPELFTVARQNQQINTPLFQAAQLDLVMQRGSVIAHKIFALITTPLLSEFLALAARQSNDWANQLVARIGGVIEDEAPQSWALAITPTEAPALYRAGAVTLGDLRRNPRRREEALPCVALLLARAEGSVLVPEDELEVTRGDQILFCGREDAASELAWLACNPDVLRYVLTGEEHPSTLLGRMLDPAGPESSPAPRELAEFAARPGAGLERKG